jgi:hypothetical protein
MAANQDITQENQWRLVGEYYRPERNVSRAQFCRDNNYPDTSEAAGGMGKYHTQLRKKIVSVEGLAAAERDDIVRHGAATGQDISKRVRGPLLVQAQLPVDAVRANGLDLLAALSLENKKRVLTIMKDLPVSELLTVIRLVNDAV